MSVIRDAWKVNYADDEYADTQFILREECRNSAVAGSLHAESILNSWTLIRQFEHQL
jgi:hypothetical protein